MEQQPPKQEVESTEVVRGRLKWFGNPSNPLPIWMSQVGKAIRYVCTGAIVACSGAPTDVMSAHTSTVISFYLGLIVLCSGGLELLVGIEPQKS